MVFFVFACLLFDFGSQKYVFELLHAKPCRIIQTFRLKISFEPETCEIGQTVGPYGPVWARMGRARALEERDKFRKSAPF